MLNKRFKVAKCKTSLKLATSRIKLMKNKKGIQMNQMKRELAQLLESGQDRTARIRVEHVIREEKMVAAYDLVEIYCELIVARLPIIESQKTCPIDLKEAIASVIFAAPRCSDIPELLDVRKQFTAKYGKEFASAAIELRPDSGVSRMLIEKLSAIAPDVQTKMKVLSAVAKEHNVNWDPTSFEEKESKPPDDLLNGPTNVEKISTINVDPPKIQTSNVQNVHSHEENPSVPVNFSQQNRRYTLDTQKSSSASTTHEDMRSSGMTYETTNMRQSFNTNRNDSSSGRENWNMEFKDATSAAQAAAESAERASMAARAAAHLSSQGKITRQYSTESQDSHISPKATKRFSRPTSLRSRNDSVEGSSVNNFRHPDGYFENSVDEYPSAPEMSKKNESRAGFMSGDNESSKIRKQPSISSYRSVEGSSVNNVRHPDGYFENSENEYQGPSSPEMHKKNESKGGFTSGDNESSKIRKQPSISAIGDDLDALTFDQKKVNRKTVVDQGSSYGDARRDDETDSDDDDDDDDDGPRFGTGFKSKFSSSENTHIWSPRIRNTTDQPDSAKSVDPSVNFDLSDGPDSENESEIAKKLSSPPKRDLKKPPIELYDLIESGSSVSDDDKSLQSRHFSRISHSKNNNLESQSVESDDLHTGNELKFGTLTGGFRNKGSIKFPPYTKTAAAPSSPSSNKSVEEIPTKTDRNSFNSRTTRLENKKPNVSISSSESDSDDYNDKFPVQSSKTLSQFAPPVAFFDDDSEDEAPPVPKPTSASRIHLGSGLSRRTKGYVEAEGKTIISNSKKDPARTSKSSEKTSNESERKSSWRSYGNKQEASGKMAESKISEQSTSPPGKIVESGKTEASKSSNAGSETSVEVNNVKKPSHVHPKLPEYDSLAARMQALRMNHR